MYLYCIIGYYGVSVLALVGVVIVVYCIIGYYGVSVLALVGVVIVVIVVYITCTVL